MAISSELIGSLGGNSVTHSRFWFSDGNREAQTLDKSWSVPRGSYLFAWQGSLDSVYNTDSRILINGHTLMELDPRGRGLTGGYILLGDVTSIALTGEGRKRFETEDPHVAFVKVN